MVPGYMAANSVLQARFARSIGTIGRPLPLAQLILSLSMDTVTEGRPVNIHTHIRYYFSHIHLSRIYI